MRNTRADVVAAALRVLDAHGLEACSMRRVAAELDVQPSALYHHVPNKQTLLALMADEIVAFVRGVDARALCVSLREAMLAVRDGADVVATATAFRLGASDVEQRLAELVDAQFGDARFGGAGPSIGSDGARTLLLYTFGQAQSTQTRMQAIAFGALLDPEPPGLSRSDDPAADYRASFERGLDIILAGLGGP